VESLGIDGDSATPAPLHERSKWVYTHLPANVDRLLDAGCHDGAATAAFARRARTTVGVDLDVCSLTAGLARYPDLKLAAADAAALPFPTGAFDCVIFSEVLEHLSSDAEHIAVAEIRRVLQPSGTLILTTPHRGMFWWLDPLMAKTHLRRAAAALSGRRAFLKGHKHYTFDEIRSLLAPHFEIRSVSRVGCLLYPLAYWGYLLPFGMGRFPPLVRLWQRMMDTDYAQDCGDRAYNICVIARAR
jgi:SAM-dependent methyltransferase